MTSPNWIEKKIQKRNEFNKYLPNLDLKKPKKGINFMNNYPLWIEKSNEFNK